MSSRRKLDRRKKGPTINRRTRNTLPFGQQRVNEASKERVMDDEIEDSKAKKKQKKGDKQGQTQLEAAAEEGASKTLNFNEYVAPEVDALEKNANEQYIERRKVMRDIAAAIDNIDIDSGKVPIKEQTQQVIRSIEENNNSKKVSPVDGKFVETYIKHLVSDVPDVKTFDYYRKGKLRIFMKAMKFIKVPEAGRAIRPTRLMREFVTGCAVLIAYLIINEISDINKIPDKFVLHQKSEDIEDMANEITAAGFTYQGGEYEFNNYEDALEHVAKNRSIGAWLARAREKWRKGTWDVVNGELEGNKEGLYAQYKDVLVSLGVKESKQKKKQS